MSGLHQNQSAAVVRQCVFAAFISVQDVCVCRIHLGTRSTSVINKHLAEMSTPHNQTPTFVGLTPPFILNFWVTCVGLRASSVFVYLCTHALANKPVLTFVAQKHVVSRFTSRTGQMLHLFLSLMQYGCAEPGRL